MPTVHKHWVGRPEAGGGREHTSVNGKSWSPFPISSHQYDLLVSLLFTIIARDPPLKVDPWKGKGFSFPIFSLAQDSSQKLFLLPCHPIEDAGGVLPGDMASCVWGWDGVHVRASWSPRKAMETVTHARTLSSISVLCLSLWNADNKILTFSQGDRWPVTSPATLADVNWIR